MLPDDEHAESESQETHVLGNDGRTKRESKSVASQLVEIAQAMYSIHLATDGTVFAVPLDGPKLTFPLRGGKVSLRATLAREYFRRHHKAATQQALTDALMVLDGIGQEYDPEQVHLRVGRARGAVWLDLGDHTGRAVRIDGTGWSVEDDVPLYFRRTSLTGPLPVPARGGDIGALWSRLNVDQTDRPLILAAAVAALIPEVPHVIIGFFGEQGSAKTTAGKTIAKLIDPSAVPVRKAPKDGESWVTAASGSWVVCLDNLSYLPDWLSDALCRASTGDGDVRRKLYTDGELIVFSFLRVIIVTGIDLGAVNGDFADRLLHITLTPLSEDTRLNDEALWKLWDIEHPKLLGALMDLTARVLRVLPSVEIGSKPRMADYFDILAAVDAVLGTDGVTRYRQKVGAIATDSLTGDPFIIAMIDIFANTYLDTFTGTSRELLHLVEPDDKKRWRQPKAWPANAREVTRLLHRQAPVMRKAGWTADELPPGHDNAVRWRIRPPKRSEEKDPKSDSQDSPRSHGASVASVASEASAPSRSGTDRSFHVCRQPLDAVLVEAGETTHPVCTEETS